MRQLLAEQATFLFIHLWPVYIPDELNYAHSIAEKREDYYCRQDVKKKSRKCQKHLLVNESIFWQTL
jgi:hypothetical protein